MTSSNGSIFRVTGHLCGNSPVTGEFPAQRPVTRSFDVFFDMRLINGWVNNRETGDLRRYRTQLWRHCSVSWVILCKWPGDIESMILVCLIAIMCSNKWLCVCLFVCICLYMHMYSTYTYWINEFWFLFCMCLRTCLCVNACLYLCPCLCLRLYLRLCLCLYRCKCLCMCLCLCLCLYLSLCLCLYRCKCLCMCLCLCRCLCLYLCVPVSVSMQVSVYVSVSVPVSVSVSVPVSVSMQVSVAHLLYKRLALGGSLRLIFCISSISILCDLCRFDKVVYTIYEIISAPVRSECMNLI